MSNWNHRVLASNEEGYLYYQIHEVYYTDGIPTSYTKNAVSIGCGEIEGLLWTLDSMKECIKKPILWAGDKFPKEVKQ